MLGILAIVSLKEGHSLGRMKTRKGWKLGKDKLGKDEKIHSTARYVPVVE